MSVGPRGPVGWLELVVIIALGLVLGLYWVSPASADTFFTVNTAADAVDINIGDGICRTAANKCSLRAAIQEANANPDSTVITLKEKVYKIKLAGIGEDLGATGDFDITSAVTIVGVSPTLTIIDAIYLDRAFELHLDGLLNLANLTVRNGFSTEAGGGISAGGDSVSLALDNVVLQGNTSETTGGAVYVADATVLQANRSKFIDNLAQQGGALYLYEAGASAVYDSLFDDNSGELGGAIATYYTGLLLEKTRFEDNLAECYITPSCDTLLMEGGALYAGNYDPMSGGDITMNYVGMYRNGATGWSGGFSIYNGIISIDTSTFDSNTAVQGGGGGYTFGANGSIGYSAFINNTGTGASAAGGGVYFQDSSLSVSSTTFSGNSAFSGGGVYVSGDAPSDVRANDTSLLHVTIANNSATDGGGLWLVTGSGGLSVVGSIIDGNTATSLGPDCGGASISINWTLISNDTDCVFTGTDNLIDQSAGLDGLSYGINGLTLAHVPMMASPVLVAEAVCSVPFDQHWNFFPVDDCTLGAVTGIERNLLLNSSFESGISGWKVKSVDGKDKVVNKPAYAGNRAFVFAGVNGKTSNLRQVVNSPILTAMASGHGVCASAMFYTKNVNAQNLTIQVLVRYSDGVVDKSSHPVELFPLEYVQACSGIVNIDLTGGRTVSRVQIKITSKSTRGKTFVDNVSATWFASSFRGASGVTRDGAMPLGLPAAPDGFRH